MFSSHIFRLSSFGVCYYVLSFRLSGKCLWKRSGHLLCRIDCSLFSLLLSFLFSEHSLRPSFIPECLSFLPRLVWVWLLGFCDTLSCNYQQHLEVISASRSSLSLLSFFEATIPAFSKIVLSPHSYAVVRVIPIKAFCV